MAEAIGGREHRSRQTRVNLTLPPELLEQARAELPEVNLSKLLREAIGAKLSCEHDHLICSRCGTEVDVGTVVGRPLRRFFGDVWGALEESLHRGAGVEGVARAIREVAVRHQVERAAYAPVPRLSRAEREELLWEHRAEGATPPSGALSVAGSEALL